MIVHVASFLESIGGSIDEEHWLRPIPGRTGYAAYCRKPQYTKKQKEEMAERPAVKAFSTICKEASAIMRMRHKKQNGPLNILQLNEKPANINACHKRMANQQCPKDCGIISDTN